MLANVAFIFFKSNQALWRQPRVARQRRLRDTSEVSARSGRPSAGGCGSRPLTAITQALGSPSRYHLAVIALIYFLPLMVMFVAYTIIGLTLWRRTVPGYQAHGANTHYLQAKKKVGARGGAGRGGARPPEPLLPAQGPPSRGRRGAQDPPVSCPDPKFLARA